MKNAYPIFNEDLYNTLVGICKKKRNVFSRSFEYDGVHYIIFHYKNNTYFPTPEWRECRGCMFEVTQDGSYIAPVCRPFEKFFSSKELKKKDLREPLIDFYGESSSYKLYTKLDGSIISSFLHKNELDFKSNQAVNGIHTIDAKRILDEQSEFRLNIEEATKNGNTVMLELTSPELKIVVPYEKSELTVIGVRNISDGQYWSHDKLVEFFGVDKVVKECSDMNIEDVYSLENVEGCVAVYDSMLRIKIKSHWYMKASKPGNNGIVCKGLLEAFKSDEMVKQYLLRINKLHEDDEEMVEKVKFILEKGRTFFENVYKAAQDNVENNDIFKDEEELKQARVLITFSQKHIHRYDSSKKSVFKNLVKYKASVMKKIVNEWLEE